MLRHQSNKINKGNKVMVICLFITIAVLLSIILFLLNRVENRQIYTTGLVDKINSYCLEE